MIRPRGVSLGRPPVSIIIWSISRKEPSYTCKVLRARPGSHNCSLVVSLNLHCPGLRWRCGSWGRGGWGTWAGTSVEERATGSQEKVAGTVFESLSVLLLWQGPRVPPGEMREPRVSGLTALGAPGSCDMDWITLVLQKRRRRNRWLYISALSHYGFPLVLSSSRTLLVGVKLILK